MHPAARARGIASEFGRQNSTRRVPHKGRQSLRKREWQSTFMPEESLRTALVRSVVLTRLGRFAADSLFVSAAEMPANATICRFCGHERLGRRRCIQTDGPALIKRRSADQPVGDGPACAVRAPVRPAVTS